MPKSGVENEIQLELDKKQTENQSSRRNLEFKFTNQKYY